jgi:translation elongation factor EF-1beta
MKSKKLFYLFFSSILLLTSFSSCSKKEPSPIFIGFSAVYIKIGENFEFDIHFGNGGYEVSVDNENIVTADVEKSTVKLQPVAKGKTTITITDSAQEKLQFTVHVVEPYIAFGVVDIDVKINVADTDSRKTIQKDIETNSILEKGYLYDLTKNAAKPFKGYKQFWDDTVELQGTYEFDEYLLTLKSAKAEVAYTVENNEYGKMFNDYLVSNTIPGDFFEYPIFDLSADLTEKYSEEYTGVQSVKVVAKVQLFIYRSE